MGESGHKIDGSILEWSLWEVSLVIDYLVHMTESGLFSPVNKSRDVALAVQVLPVSGPTLKAYSQYSRWGQMKAVYSVRSVVGSACL